MPSPSDSATSSSVEGSQQDSQYYDQAHALDLSPQLESKVSTILKVKDPLDAPHFDPTEYINRLFPNGMSQSSSLVYRDRLVKRASIYTKLTV